MSKFPMKPGGVVGAVNDTLNMVERSIEITDALYWNTPAKAVPGEANLNQREDAHRPIQICPWIIPLEAYGFPVRSEVRASPFLEGHPSVNGLDEPAMHDVIWSVVHLVPVVMRTLVAIV